MSTSEVEIANMALSQIGVRSINSFDEASLAAQQCRLFYPKLRDSILTSLKWGFATRIAPLALTAEELFNWVYIYDYPANCLKIHELIPDYQTVGVDSQGLRPRIALEPYTFIEIEEPEYQIFNIGGDKVVACNYENARIEYTHKVTDPNLFPLNFQLALSMLLASTIVVSLADIKEGMAIQRSTYQQYMIYRQQAMVDNANEMNYNQPDSKFIQIRR